jgi:small GTP-binding protein
VEDTYQRTAVVDGELCKLDVLDTAGQVPPPPPLASARRALIRVQEEFAAMRDMYMRSGHGFLLVYDVTSIASFAEMAVFRNQILSSKDVDSVPLVILGNKCDIEDAREISTEQGRDLAVQLGAKFFEGSAKFRKNVDEAFFAVVPTAGCCIDCAHVPSDAVRSDPTDSGRAPAKSSATKLRPCCCCSCCPKKEIDVLGAVNYCLGTAAQMLDACVRLKGGTKRGDE